MIHSLKSQKIQLNRYIAFLFIILNYSSYGQQSDSLNPERKIHYQINQLRSKKIKNSSEDILLTTLKDLINYSSQRIPYLTVKELRSGMAGTAAIVYIKDRLISGTFLYDSTCTSKDDGAMVLTFGGKRYVREDIGYLKPEWFGAKGNWDQKSGTGSDDSKAFALAFAAGNIVQAGAKYYNASFVIPQGKTLRGMGYSSGYGGTAKTRIRGTIKIYGSALAENFNVEYSPGNGIEILGMRVTVRNVGSHKNLGDGFNLTGNSSNNLNHFNLDGLSSTENSGYGFILDNKSDNPNLPNCNAGLLKNCETRDNKLDGFYINSAFDNSFIGTSAQINLRYGIRLGKHAKGNIFLSHYEEANVLGEILLEAGSSNNTIHSPRSGSYGDGVVADAGSNNTIFGKAYGIPLVNKMAFKSFEVFDTSTYGRWNFRRDKTNNLIAEITNSDEDANLIVRHNRGGIAGIGFKSTGNNKSMTDVVSKKVNLPAVTVKASSTKDLDFAFDEIRDYNFLLFCQSLTIPSPGVIYNIFFKKNGLITIRIANVTESAIEMQNTPFIIKGIRIKD